MSSRPGLDLEDFLMWEYDLIVGGNGGANPSLQIAEAMGQPSRRVMITEEQFRPIVELAEPHREEVERWLSDFNEETQNWRDYAYSIDWLPYEVHDTILQLIASYKKPPAENEQKEKHWAADLPVGDVFGVFGSN